MTHYIVLQQNPPPHAGASWKIIGHAEANGPHAARRKVNEGEGEFLVVPVRNATFISGSVMQPPPRAIDVDVSADTYLDVQQALPELEPEPDPVPA
jgi:hypothetical protein